MLEDVWPALSVTLVDMREAEDETKVVFVALAPVLYGLSCWKKDSKHYLST